MTHLPLGGLAGLGQDDQLRLGRRDGRTSASSTRHAVHGQPPQRFQQDLRFGSGNVPQHFLVTDDILVSGI